MNTLHATVSDLCDGFLHQLSTQPDAPAVISRDGVTKYHALGGMTAAAQEIISAARPRTVGLYFNPSAPLVAAAWASLCSGVAYVPLAPTYPEERIRYMLDSGGVDLVLTSAEERTALADILAGTGAAIEAVSAGHGIDAAPYCAADADAIAYVLYTSGSTGAPKGVEITHAALGHQLRWIGSGLELGPHSRIVHKTPISFDASQWELLANATGAAVVVGDADLYRDPQALVDTVIGHEVTHLQAVPTLLQALCEEPRFPDCTSLRLLASGGEALPTRLAASAAALLPSASLVNLYGPTETTINAAHHTVRAPTATQGGTVPIGLPVPGTGFHLLDGDGEPSASATIGELAISGRQLARGYRNRPEETDRRFVTRHIDGKIGRAHV